MRKKRCKNITSKAAKGALAAILALAMTVPLAACKDSDVLTEKIVGEVGEYDIDYDIPPVALDNPESEDSMTDQYEEEESERENEEEENTPEYDEENQTTDETTNEQVATTTTTTTNNRKATTGGSSSGSGRTGGGSTRGSSSSASSTGKKSASSLTGTGSEGESNRWVISLVPPDDADATEDVDDLTNSAGGTENSSDVPEETWNPPSESSDPNVGVNENAGAQIVPVGDYGNMTPSNGIAAVGTYALIVQALGGAGALKACNAEWYDSLPAQSFNNKSELTNTVKISAWGDGTTMNQDTFDAIVNSGADTVLTSVSYGGVTQSWAEQFLAANISVVELEPIGMANAYDADISTCVQVIGQLLKDSGCSVTVGGISYNSAQMANTWQSQHDIAIEATNAANGGYAVHTAGGYSWPIIYQSWSLSNGTPIDIEHTRFSTTYFYDWEFDDTDLSGLNESLKLKYRRYTYDVSVWPWNDFNISNVNDIHVDGSLGYPTRLMAQYLNDFNDSNFYLWTYYLQRAGLDDIGLDGGWSTNVMCRKVSDSNTDASETYKVYPGNMNMPCIIAKDTSIAERVVASASIADRSTNTVGYLNFGKDYRIVIMPSGVSGCWADGTFESFLMAPWAYCAVTDGNIDMSSVDGYVSNFYDTFYRCSADGIVNGSGSYWGSYLVAVANRDE